MNNVPPGLPLTGGKGRTTALRKLSPKAEALLRAKRAKILAKIEKDIKAKTRKEKWYPSVGHRKEFSCGGKTRSKTRRH